MSPITSSGLLDEERDTSASSTNEGTPQTFTESGELNMVATALIGRDVAGSPNVNFAGPCIYVLP